MSTQAPPDVFGFLEDLVDEAELEMLRETEGPMPEDGKDVTP
jgi:hypothetical protein